LKELTFQELVNFWRRKSQTYHLRQTYRYDS